MTKIFALTLVLGLLGGCSEPMQAATIRYAKLGVDDTTFTVEFTADQNFEALYAQNRNQKIVRKKLMCAMGDDTDFDVAHRMRYVFEGSLELQEGLSAGQNTNFRYISRGYFYENPPESSDLRRLKGQALLDVLGPKKSIPCKVVMTIYMASPYYSKIMSIPAEDVQHVANASK